MGTNRSLHSKSSSRDHQRYSTIVFRSSSLNPLLFGSKRGTRARNQRSWNSRKRPSNTPRWVRRQISVSRMTFDKPVSSRSSRCAVDSGLSPGSAPPPGVNQKRLPSSLTPQNSKALSSRSSRRTRTVGRISIPSAVNTCQAGKDISCTTKNSTPPPVETIGGVPAYAQRGPCDWNLTALHSAFLAIRIAKFGYDSTLMSLPVKVAPTFFASTFAAQSWNRNSVCVSYVRRERRFLAKVLPSEDGCETCQSSSLVVCTLHADDRFAGYQSHRFGDELHARCVPCCDRGDRALLLQRTG